MLDNIPVTVIGQLRGRTLNEQVEYNFSMTYPEGYRKAIRLMKQAEKFHRAIVCFVDTVGAYPGIAAEERGQAAAIANSLVEMIHLKVPIITVLIGHGGSGGALALCVADRIAVLEHAVLSVIAPKAGAEILLKDASKELEVTKLLKMTSAELLSQGIVDCVIKEPQEGAHSDVKEMSLRIKEYLITEFKQLMKMRTSKLTQQRQKKFRNMGNEVKYFE